MIESFFSPVFSALSESPLLAVAFTSLFGLLIGSFLNVVIYRLPKMMELEWAHEVASQAAAERGEELPEPEPFNLVRPRSRCSSCGHQITALENIPVLSWLFQKGKCTACGAKISARYPVVELCSALLAGVAVWVFGFNAVGLGAAFLSLVLLVLALIDFDTQLLPDSLTLPLLWIGLLLNLSTTFAPISAAVIGAVAGYLALWSIYWLFKILTGKEGMGYGDFKLLAALGAWFGWQALPGILFLSALVGAVLGILLITVAKRSREAPMPFGPYLAGAGLLSLYFGGSIATIFKF
jgi:leader peptidase (prepilin peptidase) / N-methyltransferase